MAKNRYIDTRFWHDTFIQEDLNPLDRYLFIYLLTNDKTNICGVYELPLKIMSFETGLEKDMILKMFERFAGKIYYIDGWIYIKNFQKYQNMNSPKIKKGVEVEFNKVPDLIMNKINNISETKINVLDFKVESTLKITRRQAVYVRDRGVCTYCNKSITSDNDVEIDHINPLSRGGADNYSNITLSCRNCNQEKSDKTAYEYKGLDIVGRIYHTEKVLKELEEDKNLKAKVQYIYPSLFESTISHSNTNTNLNSNSNRERQQVATPSQVADSFLNDVNSEYRTTFLKELEDKDFNIETIKKEMLKFIDYWTEPNKSGTKQRWQTEKTFEIKRRLTTWFNRVNDFKNINTNKIKTIQI